MKSWSGRTINDAVIESDSVSFEETNIENMSEVDKSIQEEILEPLDTANQSLGLTPDEREDAQRKH